MVQRQPSRHISLCRRVQLECADCPAVTGHSKRAGVIRIYFTQLNLTSIPKQGELNERDEQETRVWNAGILGAALGTKGEVFLPERDRGSYDDH